MIIAYAFLIGIASFRAWRIFAEDTIMERPRDWLYAKAETKSAWGFIADLMGCPWCITFWYCGVGAWIISDHEGYNPALFSLLWLAASGIAGLTRSIVERLTA